MAFSPPRPNTIKRDSAVKLTGKHNDPNRTPSGKFRPPLESMVNIKVPKRLTDADRKRIAHPYLPVSLKPNIFGQPAVSSSTPPLPQRSSSKPLKDVEEIELGVLVDAETGEVLSPTKAVWSTTEGRLNMDRHTIVTRGTGLLDVSAHNPSKNSTTATATATAAGGGGGALLRAGASVVMMQMDSPTLRRSNGGAHHNAQSNTLTTHQFLQKPVPRSMHSLVAEFLRHGPLSPMNHKYWSPETGQVTLPPGYVNDVDGDAPPVGTSDDTMDLQATMELICRNVNGVDFAEDTDLVSMSSMGSSFPSGSSGSKSNSKNNNNSNTKGRPRETPEERKARWRREKLERLAGKKSGMAKLIEENAPAAPPPQPNADPPQAPAPAQKDIVISDASTIASQLSAALDPHNPAIWNAVEARYYQEIHDYAVDYEYNKRWTKEKRMPNGVSGMDEACHNFAKWRATALKNIVMSIDEEQKRDIQRIEIEDQIEDEEKLKRQITKHDEERHAHRTFLRMTMYENEIVMVDRLYKMGILW